MNISWEGKGNIRKSSWKAFRAIFTVTDTLLLYMPDNKDSPAGIEALMPWSDFVKERCTGGVNRKMNYQKTEESLLCSHVNVGSNTKKITAASL